MMCHRYLTAAFLVVMLVCSLGAGFDKEKRVEWLDSSGKLLDSSEDCLTFSRPPHPSASSEQDLARFRLRLTDFPSRPSTRISILSVDKRSGVARDRLELKRIETDFTRPGHTPWLVLVSDWVDKKSLRLEGRALVARPGDLIEARVRVGGARSTIWTMPVGRPAGEDGPFSIRTLELRIVVLRQFKGGQPLVGQNDTHVDSIIAHQVGILNEVLAQCFIEARVPEYRPVYLENPPGSCLIAVGEDLGLPSSGGEVRLLVDGEKRGPWKVGKDYKPGETARLISHHLNEIGYVTQVSLNKKPLSFAFESADILVKRTDGTLAEVGAWPDSPIFTDVRQSMEIGSVTLADGINSYSDYSAASGTLEERTLVKALEDGDERTIDVFVINRFQSNQKQGESFVRGSGSALKNAVLLNLDALLRARHSYTLPHEIGHILLDDLGHPDDQGISRTDLLMHSSSSSAVDGPKRLTAEECSKIRSVSAYMFN